LRSDFMLFYVEILMQLFMIYDGLWLFWINDEVTPWTYVKFVEWLFKYCMCGLRVLQFIIVWWRDELGYIDKLRLWNWAAPWARYNN